MNRCRKVARVLGRFVWQAAVVRMAAEASAQMGWGPQVVADMIRTRFWELERWAEGVIRGRIERGEAL